MDSLQPYGSQPGRLLRPTLCEPMDYHPPGFSVYEILQARILEWVGISSSRGSSEPGIEPVSPMSPALAGRFFTTSATWEAHGSFMDPCIQIMSSESITPCLNSASLTVSVSCLARISPSGGNDGHQAYISQVTALMKRAYFFP